MYKLGVQVRKYTLGNLNFKKTNFPGCEYNGTLPYGHPVNTATSLLWLLYSGLEKAQSVIFLFKETFNMPTQLTRLLFTY